MRGWICTILLLLPFFLQSEVAWRTDTPHPFIIEMKISSLSISLGEVLEIETDVHYPSIYQFDANAFIDRLSWNANPLDPIWNLIESNVSSIPEKKGMEAQRIQMKIAPNKKGKWKFSLLTISFFPKEKKQSPVFIATPVFSLDVLNTAPSQAALTIAPLIPLDPQFPLELTQSNRELWIDNPEQIQKAKKNIEEVLKTRSFPWITLVFLIAAGGIAWIAYLTHDRWLKKNQSKQNVPLAPEAFLSNSIQELQKLSAGEIPPEHLYRELSIILRKALSFHLGEDKSQLTTQELAEELRKKQSKLAKQQIEQTLALLNEIDQVKFAGKTPSQKQVFKIIQQIKELSMNYLS